MKVKRLIKLLQTHDDELEVLLFSDDGELEIQGVDNVNGNVLIFGLIDDCIEL